MNATSKINIYSKNTTKKHYTFFTSDFYFRTFLGIGICFALFISCEKNTTESKVIFRYNEHANISSLDPAFARTQSNIWAVHQLFNGLVQLDDSLNIKPDIAKRWEISKDGKSYLFTLRSDIFFHKNKVFQLPDSTRNVTARDFAYSFSRLQNPEVAAPGSWILQNVSTIKAINDTLLRITLKKTFPPFLGLLTTKYASVVPKEAVVFYGNDFRKNPVGTGAFQFRLWDENNKLIFRRNPNYHEKDQSGKQLPYIDGIAITFYPEKQSEFLEFVQGNLDFLSSIDASYKDELLTSSGNLQPKYQQNIKLLKSPYLNTEYLGIVLHHFDEPLQNHNLRKAVQVGFDREKMMRYLRNNIGHPAMNSFIPEGMQGHNTSEFYTYNPQQAKQWVDQYVKKTGKAPKIAISTDANYVDICEYIQRELQKIGFECSIDLMPSSTLRQSKATAKLPFFRASWIADYPDAENYLSLFYSKNATPKGSNYTLFSNTQFDAWYEQSLKETTPEKRQLLYQKMDSLVMAHLPIIPLYYDQTVRFTQKNIEGLQSNPINLLQLKYVKKQSNHQ